MQDATPDVPVTVDPADRAMGLELEANELEDELEWAEAQGRTEDAAALRAKLEKVIGEWSAAAEEATATGRAAAEEATATGPAGAEEATAPGPAG